MITESYTDPERFQTQMLRALSRNVNSIIPDLKEDEQKEIESEKDRNEKKE